MGGRLHQVHRRVLRVKREYPYPPPPPPGTTSWACSPRLWARPLPSCLPRFVLCRREDMSANLCQACANFPQRTFGLSEVLALTDSPWCTGVDRGVGGG